MNAEKSSEAPVQEEAPCTKFFESGTGRFLRRCNRPARHEGECGPTASPDDKQNDGDGKLATTLRTNLPDGEPQPVSETAQLDNGSGATSAGGESGLPHRFRFTSGARLYSAARPIITLHHDGRVEVADHATNRELVAAITHLVGFFERKSPTETNRIAQLETELSGSISERETLTAQNEELKKQRDDAFHHASENVDDVKTAYETACDDLHEANETIARLTSRAVEASPSEFQKFCIACGRTLPGENEQLFAWREQAIQDIEALEHGDDCRMFDDGLLCTCLKSAVLLILREAPTT